MELCNINLQEDFLEMQCKNAEYFPKIFLVKIDFADKTLKHVHCIQNECPVNGSDEK